MVKFGTVQMFRHRCGPLIVGTFHTFDHWSVGQSTLEYVTRLIIGELEPTLESVTRLIIGELESTLESVTRLIIGVSDSQR